MKAIITIAFVLLFQVSGISQTKVYFSAGRSVSSILSIEDFYVFGKGSRVFTTENGYDTKGFSDLWTGELHVETPFNKVINGVTGISFFQVGYDNSQLNDDPTVGDFYSKLDVTYLGIPLLLRANIANAIHLDMGFVASIPISAKLKETRNSGTNFEQSHTGSITSSLNSNYLDTPFGGYLAFTLLINRYTLTASWQTGATKVDKKLLDTWPLGNGSMFLTDMYPSFSYEIIYLKLGIRLK